MYSTPMWYSLFAELHMLEKAYLVFERIMWV